MLYESLTQTDPALLERLRVAARYQMTPEQVRSQRLSFVYGNLPSDSTMTKHDVAEALARLDGDAS